MENVKVNQRKPLEIVLLIVGDEGVGKTTLIMKLLRRTSQPQDLPSACLGGEDLPEKNLRPTVQAWRQQIVADEMLINVTLLDPVRCKLALDIDVDYFRRSHAIIIMFDCTEQSIFFTISTWHRYIRRGAEKNTLVFVLGTNYNSKNCYVKRKEVQRLCRTLGVTKTFLLISTEPNVEGILLTIIRFVLKRKQMQVRVMERGLTYIPTWKKWWVELRSSVGSVVRSVVNWVRPSHIVYNPLTQHEEIAFSERFEEGDNADPQTRGERARRGFEVSSETPRQTEVEENEESVQLFHSSPSTSGAASQPQGTRQYTDNSAHVSVSAQGESHPVASTSLHQYTTEMPEASTVTVEAEVYERKQRPRKKSKPLAETEASEIHETQF